MEVTPVFSGSENEDEEGESGLQPSTQPWFQNELILAHLFGLCSPKLLAKCRQVCRLWRQESLTLWRSAVLVKLDFKRWDGKIQRFLEFVEHRDNGCEGKPYRRFILEKWHFRQNESLNARFWRVCASRITSLELRRCKFDQTDGFRRVVFNSFPQLHTLVLELNSGYGPPKEGAKSLHREHPNLKSITIKLDRDRNFLPVSWLELLSHFPNLTAVKFEGRESGNLFKMLTAIRAIRMNDSRKLELNHLDIIQVSYYGQDGIFQRICALLCELQFPLKFLAMNFGWRINPAFTRRILELHANTLRTLIASTDGNPRIADQAQLRTLEELSISTDFLRNVAFRKIAYECCPNLRELKVDDYHLHHRNKPIMQIDPYFKELPRLKSLTVSLYGAPFPVPWIEFLSRFPNLNTIKLRYSRQGEGNSIIVDMLKAVQTIRGEDILKLPLTHLDILDVYDDDGRQAISPNVSLLLKELQLPLECLEIDFGGETPPTIVQDILEVHSKTLKTLIASRFPYFRYEIDNEKVPYEMQLDSLEELSITSKFLEKLEFSKLLYKSCPNLQTLELDRNHLNTENKPALKETEGGHLFYREYPNLKSLTISISRKPRPEVWLELLSHYPSLTSLKLECAKDMDSSEPIVDMLKAMHTIRNGDHNNHKLQINNLDILSVSCHPHNQIKLYPSICRLLTELQLPLQSLAMDFGKETKLGVVQDMLGKHDKTLECLIALRDPKSSPYNNYTNGVWLDCANESRIADNYFDNLDFLKVVRGSCPNLVILVVDAYDLNAERRIVPYKMKDGEEVLLEDYSINIKSLTIKINRKPLPGSWLAIFSHFPTLTSMKLEMELELKEDESNVILDVLTGVQTIRKKDSGKLQLERLDIIRPFFSKQKLTSPNVCLPLRQLQLPFRSLTMNLAKEMDWDEEYKYVLKLHGRTPKSSVTPLKNSTTPEEDEISVGEVQMDSVQKLRIDANYLENMEICKIVDKSFPSLQKLVVDGYPVKTKNGPVEQQQQEAEYVEPSHGKLTGVKSVRINLNNKPLPITWLELLSLFPGLTSLKLENAASNDASNVTVEMLTAIKAIRKGDRRRLQLKHLDILRASSPKAKQVPQSVSEVLGELMFPLISLGMNFGKETEPGVVQDILQIYSGTLKRLTVFTTPTTYQCAEFPPGVQFCSVGKLRIAGKLVENLEFLTMVPNLKKLHIGNNFSERTAILTDQIVRNPSLAYLKMVCLTEFYISHPVGVEDLRRWVVMTPNVQKLSMLLGDEQFRIVCEAWRNLQHLKVLGYWLTDEGVTGAGENSARLDPEQVANRPNITWLKSLTSFTLAGRDDAPHTYPDHLTDASAFHGFLRMDKLQSLEIRCKMSNEAKVALKGKIPNCKVIDPMMASDPIFYY